MHPIFRLAPYLLFTTLGAPHLPRPSIGSAPMGEPYNSYVDLMSFTNLDVSGLLPLNCLKVKSPLPAALGVRH